MDKKTAAKNAMVRKIKKHLKRHKFALKLDSVEFIEANGVQTTGYFSEDDREIVIAGKSNDWFYTLIHEYCHFLQYITKEPLFFAAYAKTISADLMMDAWLNHEIELSQGAITWVFETMFALEKDCEERAIALLKKDTDLKSDLDLYYMKANCYLAMYKIAPKMRQWYNGKKPPYSDCDMFYKFSNCKIQDDFHAEQLGSVAKYLIKNQAVPEVNGIYTVSASGADTRTIGFGNGGTIDGVVPLIGDKVLFKFKNQ